MAETGDQDHDALIAQASGWLARLDAGRASPEDFQAWRDGDPRRAAAFAEVASAWGRLDALRDDPEGRAAVRQGSMNRRTWLAGGGALLAAGATGAIYLDRDRLLRSRITTRVGERRTLSLPDGSSLDLNTDTEVSWRFDDRLRRVWLERGEAALLVARDLVRPFVLTTAAGVTRLSAGQFNVRLRSTGVSLIVLAGAAVAETAMGRAEARVAQTADARQMLDITPQGVSVVPAKAQDVEVVEAWRRGEIVFDGQRLADAVEEYNRYLPRKLVVLDARVGDLRLGGRFLAGDPDGFLVALRSSFGVRAEPDGPSRILLKSP